MAVTTHAPEPTPAHGRPASILPLAGLAAYTAVLVAREASTQHGSPGVTIVCNLVTLPLGAAAVWLSWQTTRAATLDARLRSAWRWLAASFAAFWAGDVLFLALRLLRDSAPVGASPADAVYLASYAIGLLGVLKLRGPRPSGERRMTFLLDAAIVGVGAAMVAWHAFVAPTLHDPQRAVVGMTALAYVVGDLVLLFGVAVVLLRPLRGGLRASLALLGGALVLRCVADVVFWRGMLGPLQGSPAASSLYACSWFLLAAAAHAQARTAPFAAVARVSVAFSPTPYLAAAFGYAVLLHVVASEADPHVLGLLAGGVALTVAVLVRQLLGERARIRLAAERTTQVNEARFRSLVENASDIVLLTGPSGEIRYHTPSAERFLDPSGSSLDGTRLHGFLHPDDRASLDAVLAEAAARPGSTPSAEWRLRWTDGSWHFVEVRARSVPQDPHLAGGVILTLRSVHERKVLEERLAYQAFHDPLTQLANRNLFTDRLEHALVRAHRVGRPLAVLFIDLDDFKDVNDSFGHAAGDAVLVEVARRLLMCVRAVDTAARLGGDEFAVLVDEGGIETAREISARVTAVLAEPFEVGRSPILLSASVGIAGDLGVETADDLLRNADVAMYRAKRSGKGQVVVFAPAMQAALRERLALEAALRAALERDALTLSYQPIVALATGRVVGAEAALVWEHPSRGRLRSTDLLAIAAAAGAVPALAASAVRQACRCAAEWPPLDEAGTLPLVVLGVQPELFADGAFLEGVLAAIHELRLPSGRLVLALTERATIEDGSTVLGGMSRLRASGVRVAIHDFGAGYSSLSRLRHLPVDVLKLDTVFVDGIARDPGLGPLTRGVLDLARALGKLVVAEGIDRREQAERLREHGCAFGQGLLFPGPLEGRALGELMESGRPCL